MQFLEPGWFNRLVDGEDRVVYVIHARELEETRSGNIANGADDHEKVLHSNAAAELAHATGNLIAPTQGTIFGR